MLTLLRLSASALLHLCITNGDVAFLSFSSVRGSVDVRVDINDHSGITTFRKTSVGCSSGLVQVYVYDNAGC